LPPKFGPDALRSGSPGRNIRRADLLDASAMVAIGRRVGPRCSISPPAGDRGSLTEVFGARV
jgi:hypothetical protein